MNNTRCGLLETTEESLHKSGGRAPRKHLNLGAYRSLFGVQAKGQTEVQRILKNASLLLLARLFLVSRSVVSSGSKVRTSETGHLILRI